MSANGAPPPGMLPPGVPPPGVRVPRMPQSSQKAMDKTLSQDHTQNQVHVFSNALKKAMAPLVRGPVYPINTGKATSESDDEDAESVSEDSPDLVDKLVEQLQNRLSNDSGLDLEEDKASYRVINSLISTISKLQVENQLLKEQIKATKVVAPNELTMTEDSKVEKGNSPDDTGQPITEHIYCVQHHDDDSEYGYYKDAPSMFKGDRKKDVPRGTIPIPEATVYLENHPSVAFVTIDTYRTSKSMVQDIFEKVGHLRGALSGDYSLQGDPKRKKRTSVILSPLGETALANIMDHNLDLFEAFQGSHDIEHFEPYTLFYIHGKNLQDLLSKATEVDEKGKIHLQFLLQWMETNFRKDWDEADALFAQGKFNEKHFDKLYRPGELVVYDDELSLRKKSSLVAGRVPTYPHIDYDDDDRDIAIEMVKFRGGFSTYSRYLDINEPSYKRERTAPGRSSQEDEVIEITRLYPHPMRFAKEGVKEKLVARGNKFWRYKSKKLVCSSEVTDGNEIQAERRHMIDYNMFRRMHPDNPIFNITVMPRRPFVSIENDPDDSTLACMPATLHGFDFAKKAWGELKVDHLTDVTWNKTAFQQLVVPNSTKELIQAMVTEHGHKANAALDIIEGKGQGLLILLHGGPGTGKTLTAESIAELQERPLYRVTCGDIGTEPAQVEQYLGDVLEIGRAWGCVVLLDEADVFLEERSFNDQKRNAIISIFLRVLEYYDGILILTTNRVGSFDEAFKSRIQLALAYPRLNEEDRFKVWRNFINMLQRTEDRVDIDDLKMNLAKLARYQINGRQIRNVITMSRHLAKFRGEMLRYQHMQDAVQSVQKFNEYLNEVKGGVHDEDWARLDKLR